MAPGSRAPKRLFQRPAGGRTFGLGRIDLADDVDVQDLLVRLVQSFLVTVSGRRADLFSRGPPPTGGFECICPPFHPELCRQRGIDYQEQTSTRRSRPSALTSAT